MVTTNSYIRKMNLYQIIKEYPELNEKIKWKFMFIGLGTMGLSYLFKYNVKITETKENEKTYDYKTKKLIQFREGPTRSTQDIIY